MNTIDHLDLGEYRVLVVDNDRNYRRLMANMLHNIGIGVVQRAASADEAQAEIRNSFVQFVLVDRTLEGVKGLALIRYLRDPETTPSRHIRIIMTTDDGHIQHIMAAIKVGADHCLVKPISPAELEATIRSLIARPPEKIEVRTYVGPCRRRLPTKLYGPYEGEDRRHDLDSDVSEPEASARRSNV